MELWSPVKITVIKRLFLQEIADEYLSDEMKAEGFGICNVFKDGQEFILTGPDMPPGFCAWAWADLHRDVIGVLTGASMNWSKGGAAISCCTDGYRPVFFKIERIDAP